MKSQPPPLSDVPAGVPGHRVLFITLETVQTRGLDGRHTGVNGHWVRRRYSDKPLVWLPQDVVGNPRLGQQSSSCPSGSTGRCGRGCRGNRMRQRRMPPARTIKGSPRLRRNTEHAAAAVHGLPRPADPPPYRRVRVGAPAARPPPPSRTDSPDVRAGGPVLPRVRRQLRPPLGRSRLANRRAASIVFGCWVWPLSDAHTLPILE
jgi:hypothetical protein